ncbi:hypothetical protein MTP99_014286 [Tenebrio molitor]|jgi:hypothetical protein|nr:hypothetical protein MTP99_014286 [Tenebrio molitor]
MAVADSAPRWVRIPPKGEDVFEGRNLRRGMDVCVSLSGTTVGWWKEVRYSSDTTARSAGFESQAGWASHGCCVLLYSCCVVQKKEKGEERVGVGGRGKYPGAPPHHIRKKRKTSRPQRYLIDQVVKGERL